jgi:proteasome assembly chaperone (PAC2) family protein
MGMKRNPSKAATEEPLKASHLLIIWRGEGRGLETRVLKFLVENLEARAFKRLDPTPYFPLDGVVIREDVAHFPESIFSTCSGGLLLLHSDPPQGEWFQFISGILDVAERLKVREIYTLGMMYSIGAHTTPREIYGIFSSREMKESLRASGLSRNVDYQTPGNQRPTLSSFLIWLGEKRGVSGVNLWVTVPYYLTGVGDPKAEKKVLQFMNNRMGLGLDLAPIDRQIVAQSNKIGQLRANSAEIDESINKLEAGISLSDDEALTLVREIEKAL